MAARDTTFGRQLKHWRATRGFSQLDLALSAEVSQRHISFIETGRSRPGPEMIARVAEALEVPLRERNALFEAAGLPAAYPERPLSDETAAPFRQAIARILEGHEPYPAIVINRWWELVDANRAARRMFPVPTDGSGDLVELFFGPGPFREMVENWESVVHVALSRLRREAANAGPDDRLGEMVGRAEAHLKDLPPPEDHGGDLVI